MQYPQLRFGPYTFLSLTNQSVNLHIALKPMFYLLIVRCFVDIFYGYYPIDFIFCFFKISRSEHLKAFPDTFKPIHYLIS